MIDIRLYGAVADGVTDCSGAINAAILVGDIIIKDGIFIVAESIKIPSNRTVYGKNAKVKLASGIRDNIFRNSDFVNGNTNCKIIGLGNFSIEQTSANDDNCVEYGRYGAVNAYKYLAIAFCNVTYFEISGFTMLDAMRWSTVLQKCSYGSMHDIRLNRYTEIGNEDGIDICYGSHDLEIYNITGVTEDDFFAINTHPNADFAINAGIANYNTQGVYNINCHNFSPTRTIVGSLLALCTGAGNPIHGISSHGHRPKSCGSIIYTYNESTGSKDDVYDITIDDVIVSGIAQDYVSCFMAACKNITMTNIINNSAKPNYYFDPADLFENISLNGVNITP